MTPSLYLAAARDIVILAAIGLLLWWVYRSGQNAVKASDLKGLQSEIQQQAKTLSDWRKEATDANEQLSQDVSAINAAAAIPVQHVWVRDTSCPQPAVLPTPAGKANGEPAAAGPVQPGVRTDAEADRRDAIVGDFKQRWETTIAQCRALDAQWPSP